MAMALADKTPKKDLVVIDDDECESVSSKDDVMSLTSRNSSLVESQGQISSQSQSQKAPSSCSNGQVIVTESWPRKRPHSLVNPNPGRVPVQGSGRMDDDHIRLMMYRDLISGPHRPTQVSGVNGGSDQYYPFTDSSRRVIDLDFAEGERPALFGDWILLQRRDLRLRMDPLSLYQSCGHHRRHLVDHLLAPAQVIIWCLRAWHLNLRLLLPSYMLAVPMNLSLKMNLRRVKLIRPRCRWNGFPVLDAIAFLHRPAKLQMTACPKDLLD